MKVEKLSFLLPNASTFGKAKVTKNSIKRVKRKLVLFSERENFI